MSNEIPVNDVIVDESLEAEAPALETGAPEVINDIKEKVQSGETLTKQEQRQLKEYKIKVNGLDEVIKFDPHNDEEVTKWLQKGRGSDQKFQEAADIRKAAVDFFDQLRNNTTKVLTDKSLGVPRDQLRKFAEEFLQEEIVQMQKTPHEREIEELRQKLDQELNEKNLREQTRAEQEKLALDRQYEASLSMDIQTAIESNGLPKTPAMIYAMTQLMSVALEKGINLTAKDIAPIMKAEKLREHQEIARGLPDDQLDEWIGKEISARIRKKNVSKAMTTSNSIKNVGKTSKTAEVKQQEKIPMSKFFNLRG